MSNSQVGSKIFFLTKLPDPPLILERDKTIIIGRSDINDLIIPETRVSRRHAKIEWYDDKNSFVIKDLQSLNGTFVNGKRIGSNVERRVKEGDTIVIGMTLICLGESCSDRVLSFLDSVEPHRKFGDTNTFLQKDRTVASQQT